MRISWVIGLLLSGVICWGQNYNFDGFTIGWGKKGAEYCMYVLTAEMVEADTLKFNRPRFRSWKGVSYKDYTRSGYDRGHLAPAKSFSFSGKNYVETFTMGNVIPQSPFINQRIWNELEEYERALAIEEQCVVVVINVHYPEKGKRLGKVSIPDGFTRTIRSCDLKEIYGEFYVRNIKGGN